MVMLDAAQPPTLSPSDNDPLVQMRVTAHRRVADGLLQRLSSAVASERRGLAHRLTRAYLASNSARVLATRKTELASLLAYAGLPAAFDDIIQLSALVNPFSLHGEPVRWRFHPKRSGRGYRTVCTLPWRLKAAHYLIGDVLHARLTPGDHIFDWRRRGRDREAWQIQAALEQGFEWCFVGDLTNCFQSVKTDALYDILPLPAAVIEHCLDYRHLTFAYGHSNDVHRHDAREWDGPRGLLQGSPASNIVLAWLFNDLPSAMPPGCAPFLISDNVLVAAHSEQECRAIEQHLSGYFAGHPAGPFTLTGKISSLDDEIEHVGYAYSRGENGVIITPAHDGHERMMARFLAALREDLSMARDEPLRALRCLQEALSGYRAWSPDDRQATVEAHVHEFYSWFAGQFASEPPNLDEFPTP